MEGYRVVRDAPLKIIDIWDVQPARLSGAKSRRRARALAYGGGSRWSRKKLLSSITGMQNGRGAPTKEALNGLKRWCLSHAGTDSWRLLLSHVAARQEGCDISETTELDVLAAFRRNSDTEP